MHPVEILSRTFRVAQIIVSAAVVGVNGQFVRRLAELTAPWGFIGRFLYTEILAAMALFSAAICLFPFNWTYTTWPIDLFFSLGWFAAFGIMIDDLPNGSCALVFDWQGVPIDDTQSCAQWKAATALALIGAVCSLTSTILDFVWVRNHHEDTTAGEDEYIIRPTISRTSRASRNSKV